MRLREFTRRSAMAGALAATALPLKAATPVPSSLRFLKIRHSAFIIEIGARRVLIDPAFAADLGFRPLAHAKAPALREDELGRIDIVCVTSSRPDHFDTQALRFLARSNPYCFVADEVVKKRCRHHGLRRVRIVKKNSVHSLFGIEIKIAPSVDARSPNRAQVGFRFQSGERSLWHTGAQRPLDDASPIVAFAKEHPTEVVLAAAGGVHSMQREDAAALGQLASAQLIVPHHDARELNTPFKPFVQEGSPRDKTVLVTPGWRVVKDGQWNRVLKKESP